MTKDSYIAGRDEKCDIVLRPYMFDHPSHISAVSKCHFRITKVGFVFFFLTIIGVYRRRTFGFFV